MAYTGQVFDDYVFDGQTHQHQAMCTLNMTMHNQPVWLHRYKQRHARNATAVAYTCDSA